MNKLPGISSRIEQIKNELAAIDEMRPGALSMQTRHWGGTYWQLSYTHQGKGRTQYVREEQLERVKQQVANYRKFRELTKEWIDLAIEECRLKGEDSGGTL